VLKLVDLVKYFLRLFAGFSIKYHDKQASSTVMRKLRVIFSISIILSDVLFNGSKRNKNAVM
jgi:hypothetical protein